MPIVEVSLPGGQSEETKARLVREISNVLAEAVGRPLEGIHVVINEKRPEDWGVDGLISSRTAVHAPDGPIPGRASFAWVSNVTCPVESFDKYQEFRQTEISPALARTPGYIDSLMLRSTADPTRYISVTRWLSKDLNSQYRASRTHDDLRAKSTGLTGTGNVGASYEIVHDDGR